MGDSISRKTFRVFNQEFMVDERYNVTKELGQGAYGIVWCVLQSFDVVNRSLRHLVSSPYRCLVPFDFSRIGCP